jgi:hypothetical protein
MPEVDDDNGVVDSKQIKRIIVMVMLFHALLAISGQISFATFFWGIFMQLLYCRIVSSFPKFNMICTTGLVLTGAH